MERFGLPLHRGISVRSILTFVLVVVFTTLLGVILGSQATHAAEPTAAWSGESIIYDNHGYNKATDFKDATGTIPSGATVYKTPPQTTEGSSAKKVFILYFSSGVDPPTATSVKYVEFNISASNVTSSPKNARDVTLTQKGKEEESSSCSIEGIGWIVCPVSVFIAEGMDTIFQSVLAPLIAVQPSVLGDPNNSMYVAWNIMRNIANVAFVIVFLIIIYSQLTNFGVSNYGLKKLLPRLIIAAVLVNVSFIVAAAAIDASNILGYSIQGLFNTIRENVFHLTNDDVSGINANQPTWTAVATTILAGGGAIGGVYYLATGGPWLLIPLLLGLIFVLLLVVIVLAARQAIIVILVIIAPLAFVANLLPNTEKWFDKWKDLFFTMLIFFPAFSLVFGGSQLAGQLIIQNSGDNIIMLLFGLAVQIAPLVITPLLLRFSGNLLGKIAQIANNPSKGILDRNKNWAQARADNTRARNWAGEGKKFNPTTWGAGMVRGVDGRKKNRDAQTEAYKARGDNRYHDKNKGYAKINDYNAVTNTEKDAIHNRHEAHTEKNRINPSSPLYSHTKALEKSKDNLEAAQKRTATYYNNERTRSGSTLNTSWMDAEESKTYFESSEQEKATYLTRMKTSRVTALGIAAERLESAKSTGEGATGRYNSYLDTLRTSPTSSLSSATEYAESGKELAEAAQKQLDGYMNLRRKNPDTTIGQSTLVLENAKSVSEMANSELTTYITRQRVEKDGVLRAQTILTEGAKSTQQVAEEQLTKLVTDFKSGKLEAAQLNPGEEIIMQQMKSESITLAAEKQAVNNAQYEVQSNIANVMTGQAGDDALTEQMLTIAQGVGGEGGRVRAVSQAVSQARGLMSDALKSNVELLKDEARRKNTNIKYYSKEMIDRYSEGYDTMLDGSLITPERLKAAWQAQAEEKNVPLFEKERYNPRFDQGMINEIISLNNSTFKVAGAFAMQDRLDHNIENYSAEELDHIIHIDRISNLANANASGLSSWKMGQIVSMADPDNLKADIGAALSDIQVGEQPGANEDQQKAAASARAYLEAAYDTVRSALTNPDIRDTINDRAGYVRKIEKALARVHGRDPLDQDTPEVKTDVDLDTIFADIEDNDSSAEEDEDGGDTDNSQA